MDLQLRRLRATGHYSPPRFFGYYFQGATPVGVAGSWTVTLDNRRPISLLPGLLEPLTQGKYSIVSPGMEKTPDFVLVHDRRDGACWLWTFRDGLRFIESLDPVTSGLDDAEASKLAGP
ncbi:MAG: hypothetical protein JNL39_07915 [Opitutaceae bacterium]|nr:hypothetical protein [Opitutaceae bacterium]